jgi:sugar lactone lactonase YvrE
MTRALIAITAIIASCVFLTGSVSAHPASGIVVDRNNQIYFSDLETVWKIDTQGRLTVFRAGVSGRHTHDLSIDDDGNFYGADNSYEPSTQRFFSAIWRITPAGSFSYLLAPTDDPPEGTSVCRDRDGNTYHATIFPERELLVLKRSPNGNVTVLVGSTNAARDYRQGVPYSIGGMTLGPDGSLYLTDGPNLRKVTMDGKMTLLAQNLAVDKPTESPMPDSKVTRLFGIVVDPTGNVFVADNGNRRVLKVTSGGTILTVAQAEKPWAPTGVALKDGTLYILEFGFTPPSTYTPRVRKLSSDGRIAMVATLGENANAANGESPGRNSERSSEPRSPVLYSLLGVGVGALIVTGFIWRKRRRGSAQHSQPFNES